MIETSQLSYDSVKNHSTLASGEHPRPAVGHQAAVYEVPEGAGCRGR